MTDHEIRSTFPASARHSAGRRTRAWPIACLIRCSASSFVLAAAVSLGASWLLVVSLERVGARLGLSEALLGMLAALAADAPEITAAVTALVHHDQRIGAGVVIGSNVFNLAALIGLSGIVAGQIALHRRVIELAGAVALWIAAVTLALVIGRLLAARRPARWCSAVLGPYLVILGMRHERLRRLRASARVDAAGWWRRSREEELELEVAIHPRRGGTPRRPARRRRGGGRRRARASRWSAPPPSSALATACRRSSSGALVLAAVTSLPNAVAAVYLAMRGSGAAVLSTSLNSNAHQHPRRAC